jgi:hypothetical protein
VITKVTEVPTGLAKRLPLVAWKLWWAWRCHHWFDSGLWESKLRAGDLRAAGLTRRDIDWLLSNRFLKIRSPRSRKSQNRCTPHDKQTLVALTERGGSVLEQFCQHAVKPFWDPARRELSAEGGLIKAFRQPSRNQETVLAAFQEDCWAERIDDPLPRLGGTGIQEAKTRLRKTVEHLNRAQYPTAISFSVAGNGQQVRWSFARHRRRGQLAIGFADAHRDSALTTRATTQRG